MGGDLADDVAQRHHVGHHNLGGGAPVVAGNVEDETVRLPVAPEPVVGPVVERLTEVAERVEEDPSDMRRVLVGIVARAVRAGDRHGRAGCWVRYRSSSATNVLT